VAQVLTNGIIGNWESAKKPVDDKPTFRALSLQTSDCVIWSGRSSHVSEALGFHNCIRCGRLGREWYESIRRSEMNTIFYFDVGINSIFFSEYSKSSTNIGM
jgi:hypothetical protein